MVYIFYNKLLLRVLALLAGVGIGLATFQYVSLSAAKLPEQGARDALAIISFLIAGWIVMLIAEVVDNHYVRVFGALCVGLGAYVSYKWIFLMDGPLLLTLPGAAEKFATLRFGYWAAVAIAELMLLILVTRLIMDRVSYGRMPAAAAAARNDVSLGAAPVGAGEKPRAGELPPIPIDVSPLNVNTGSISPDYDPGFTSSGIPEPMQPYPAGPVRRLSGIGGLYLGSNYDLEPGELTIGRQGADITLANDTQVSRAHAVLRVDDGGIVSVTDQGSTNGTFVNNQRVQQATLAPGDVLRIGTTLFKAEG
jgi:hypothetical protein